MMKLIWTVAAAALLTGCGAADTPAPADPEQPGGAGGQTPPAAAAPSESRAFRDWRAVCDNGNACVAFGPASEATGWVRIAVSPGPDARPSVMAGFWTGEDTGRSDALTLIIDGERFVATPTPDADTIQGRLGDADAVRAIAAMARGRTMSLAAAAGDHPSVSLSGVSAALLWIDERQGRLDSTTALIRRGARPASAVPAAPPLPRVMPAPPVAQAGFGAEDQTLPAALEALPAVKACRAETSYNDYVGKAVISARLDAATELWGVPCFSGAYNIGHDWYVTGPGGRNPRPAVLASASGETGAGTVNGDYAPETRTLSEFNKGRGLGDCGIVRTWTWTGQAFALTSGSEMTECWGMPSDLWPTTWRTR
jgi:hypothetical protein